MQQADSLTPRQFAIVNGMISALVVAFLVWLVYFHRGSAGRGGDSVLPSWNALFNGTSAILLLAARRAILAGKRLAHQQLIFGALASSALFLISYVYYHYTHGDTKFTGTGPIRPVYFAILISHIGLSVLALPMILSSLYLALSRRFSHHKKLSRYTWACWMYVSVSGVAVYLMLHVIPWA